MRMPGADMIHRTDSTQDMAITRIIKKSEQAYRSPNPTPQLNEVAQ